MMSLLRFVSLFMVFFAVACTNGRGLPKGQVLYRGAKVKVVADDKKWNLGTLKSEAESVVAIPAPNKSFLGMSPSLWIYLHTKDGSWVQRKMGKAPVVLKNDMPRTTELLLGNRAANNGFFRIEVESKRIDRPLKRTAKMRYEVRVKAPAYLIDSVAFPNVAGAVETRIRVTQNKTLLKKGEPYNLEKIKQERLRITTALQKEGYYYFKPDYLSIQADTLAKSGRVNLKLVVKPSASERSRTAQTINNITFLAQTDTIGKEQQAAPGTHECISFGQMTGHKLSRSLLQKSMCLRCLRTYNPDEHDATLAYLSHLNTYKFINVGFVPSPLADSLMDVRVLLTPFARNKTKINLSGVFSPNLYWGAEFKGYVDHRNTFGHGELLRWSFSGEALRLPKQDEESNDLNLFPLETGLTLLIPRFRPPRVRHGKYFAPLVQTKLSLNYQMTRFVILPRDLIEERLGVTLHEFEFEGGLVLKNSRRPTITQEFNFIQFGARFTTIQPPAFRDAFETLIQLDSGDQYINFAPELTLGPNYVLVVDNRFQLTRRNNQYYRGLVQVRGGGFLPSELTSPSLPNLSLVTFLENDFRFFHKLNNKTSLGVKALVNTGLPISKDAAYTFNINDLYTVGGANSVRAFPPRYYGPGTISPTANSEDILVVTDHAGNILLESSLEHRYRFLPRWEVASFLDVGNIWVLAEIPDYPGGVFKFDSFYKEFGVGAGFGLRYVYSFLIIRLDLSTPLRKPWLPDGDRWVIDDMKFGDPDWRKENLLLNFAVGYPF